MTTAAVVPPAPDVDVIVVGAGNAALVAALAAHEAGARVLVLEAAPHAERGGNSRFSGGIFRVVHDGGADLAPLLTDDARRWLSRIEVSPYSAADFAGDLVRTSGGLCDPALADRLVTDSRATVEWMRDAGVKWELAIGKLVDPENIPEGERYVLPAGGAVRAVEEGVGLMDDLDRAVDEAGIPVWCDAPVHELLTEGSTVRGVRVRLADEHLDVTGAVILACGGFESNAAMRQAYLGPGWDLVKVRGTRFNMGTGLGAAVRAGAQPAGHWGGCHASPLDADAPPFGELRLTDKLSRYSYPYGVLVNLDGDRFVDEGEDEVWLTYAKTGAAIRSQPRGIAVQIFDQKTVHLLEPRYSTANPVTADTIEELAALLGIPAVGLARTIADYNAATSTATFDPFAKDGLATGPVLSPPKSNWALPIDVPPFVAYRTTCGITFTYGGLRIDDRGRVLDTENQPMPGLYATGEITGGFFFHNYPAGSGLMRGAVYGRIAGAEAATAGNTRRAPVHGLHSVERARAQDGS